MKNLFWIILTVLIFSACGGGEENASLEEKKATLKALESEVAALKAEIEELDPIEEVVRPVTIVQTKANSFDHYINVSGTSFSEKNVQVTTDMGGLVKAVYIDEGQYVSAGAIMFQLDNSTILPQIAEIETALSLAQLVYEKRQNLWNQNIGSEIEYLQAKNQYESLQKSLATAQSQLAKTSIKAPISGYIDAVNLKVGEMASPGHPAAQVLNLSNMEVHANVAEVYLGTVKAGDKVLVSFPVLGIVKEAIVKAVGQNISTTNRTFKVIASLNNTNGEVKPNMLAEIKINDLHLDSAIAIPSKLIQQSTNDYFVFIANTDSTSGKTIAERVIVKTGESYDGLTVIEKGIPVGTNVIDEGYRDVIQGTLVAIEE